MQGAVREIVVTMETGATLRIFSNDLVAHVIAFDGIV
jgi:hypothetical protein